MPPEYRPFDVLRVLLEQGVDFVVIGGFAAVLRGSPLPTLDIDITPRQGSDNLARLSAALRELDAKVRAVGLAEPLPFGHDAESLASVRVWNLTTAYGDLDISFVPSGTRGFNDLRVHATREQLHGMTVMVASLADIIRSKEAAGRDKDRRALPVLREILASRVPR